jgi:hypothetical protein
MIQEGSDLESRRTRKTGYRTDSESQLPSSLMVRSQPVSSAPANPATASAASTPFRIDNLRTDNFRTDDLRSTAISSFKRFDHPLFINIGLKIPDPAPPPPARRLTREAGQQTPQKLWPEANARDVYPCGHSQREPQTRSPATQPVMKVAREPDTMERAPSDATSDLRLGARPPIPPSKMASEPKLAKPQSA